MSAKLANLLTIQETLQLIRNLAIFLTEVFTLLKIVSKTDNSKHGDFSSYQNGKTTEL